MRSTAFFLTLPARLRLRVGLRKLGQDFLQLLSGADMDGVHVRNDEFLDDHGVEMAGTGNALS
jgi:hypothetical protein